MRSDGSGIAGIVIPLALVLSFLAHLAFLTPAVILGDASPLDTSPSEAVTVEIVSPEEVGKSSTGSTGDKPDEPPSADKPADEAKVAEMKTVEMKAEETRIPPPPPPAAPAKTIGIDRTGMEKIGMEQPPGREAGEPPAGPASAASAAEVFGMPLTLPGGAIGYENQGPAAEKPHIAAEAIAAFRRHLKTCSTLPAGVSAQAKVTLRIHLAPDGTLMKGLDQNPHPVGMIYEIRNGGGDLLNAAAAAVRRCQPYTMLPPDRYDEWRTLDMTFTPENFRGE